MAQLDQAEHFVGHPKWSRDFGRPILAYRRYADPEVIELLDELHQAWETNSVFLSQHRIACRAVLSQHILTVMEFKQVVLNMQRQKPLRYPEHMAAARKHLMRFYFDTCRQECIDNVGKFARVDSDVIERIWVEMLFRGILWHAIHNLDEKVVAVPPRYADSNLPIYIA